jgi:hypothetical protein
VAEQEANKEETIAKATSNKAIIIPIEEGDMIVVVLGTLSPYNDPLPTPESDLMVLPHSTVPVHVEEGRSKRQRANTRYYSALQAGDSQTAYDKRLRQ